MKISALSAAASLALAAAFALPASAANDGIINFTGLVTDVTCTVEGQQPGAGTVVKDVNLHGVPASKLAAAGDRANHTGFTIKIGATGEAGCTDGRKAMVSFDPTSAAIDVATGRLNTDVGTGAATNVQIEVTQGTASTPINVFTEASNPVEIVNNQALLPLGAQFYATGAATEGTVASRVGFMVVYDN